jgi:hypothetical protein
MGEMPDSGSGWKNRPWRVAVKNPPLPKSYDMLSSYDAGGHTQTKFSFATGCTGCDLDNLKALFQTYTANTLTPNSLDAFRAGLVQAAVFSLRCNRDTTRYGTMGSLLMKRIQIFRNETLRGGICFY